MLSSDISICKNGSWSFAQKNAAELFVITKFTTPEANMFKNALYYLKEPVAYVISIQWKTDFVGFTSWVNFQVLYTSIY